MMGRLECESRKQKFHVETLFLDEMPMMKFRSNRAASSPEKWCDFVQFAAGWRCMSNAFSSDLVLRGCYRRQGRLKMTFEIVDVVKGNASALGLFPDSPSH